VPVHDHDENRRVVAEYAALTYPANDLRPADIVMKGGITSGVVYPLAVCELARTHTFRSVGGSSAGGIAAAFAAAAETARGTGGFQRLACLPEELGRNLPELFQPSRRTRPLFDVFRALTTRRRYRVPRPLRVVWVLLSRQWPGAFAGLVLATASAGWPLMLARGAPRGAGDWGDLALDLWPAIPLLVLGALLGAVAGSVLGALRELPRNGHGLCIGSNGTSGPPARGVPPFTDWLSAKLSEVAGRPGVLTFGDLWGEDAVGRYRARRTDTAERREPALRAARPDVRLEMMTTNVSQARPVRLPFVEDVYFYCEREVARWFPPDVVAALAKGGVARDAFDQPWRCPEHGTELRKMPEPPDFPVVVAVRMTLSFPGLISAVPLWVVDFNAKPAVPVRCHFSDGGISSNFPIHFFDALLPSRPTFAISLGPYPKGREDEHVYYAGPGGAPPRVAPTGSSAQFAGAILDTLQNWSDNGQSRLPGYRDRIVEVRTAEHEGGMNLDMDEETILDLAVRGRDAARKLLDARYGFRFDRHRRVRFHTAMAELQDALDTMAGAYDTVPPDGSPAYAAMVPAEFGNGWKKRTDTLLRFAGRAPNGTRTTMTPNLTTKRPRPDPDLRVVPHF
jgi:predicted acylesterase/phospholipase RssA